MGVGSISGMGTEAGSPFGRDVGEGILVSFICEIQLFHTVLKNLKNLSVDPTVYLSVSQSVVYRSSASASCEAPVPRICPKPTESESLENGIKESECLPNSLAISYPL